MHIARHGSSPLSAHIKDKTGEGIKVRVFFSPCLFSSAKHYPHTGGDAGASVWIEARNANFLAEFRYRHRTENRTERKKEKKKKKKVSCEPML